MALINWPRRLIFCPTAGTASTSVCDFLIKHAGFQWVPAETLARDGYFIEHKHSGLPALRTFGLIDDEFARSAWSFSFVRDPFGWYVSQYRRHRLWASLLTDPTSWVHRDPNIRARIMAAQGDFLVFCQLVMRQNRPATLARDAASWELFHWTATDCSAVFRYEAMQVAQTQIISRLDLGSDCRFPFINKTPVATSLRANLDLFMSGAAELIATTHRPTFEQYGYPAELRIAAQAHPEVRIPRILPADFSSARYLELNPDLREVGIDPIEHYLAYGQFELRRYL